VRITRRHRFYAAHRNERMTGSKCERLHGHRYGVEVDFDFVAGGPVTVPFEDLDAAVEPILAALDHRTLVHAADVALIAAIDPSHRVVFDWPTSAENLAAYLLASIREVEPSATALRLAETDSSVVTATVEDLERWPTATA